MRKRKTTKGKGTTFSKYNMERRERYTMTSTHEQEQIQRD